MEAHGGRLELGQSAAQVVICPGCRRRIVAGLDAIMTEAQKFWKKASPADLEGEPRRDAADEAEPRTP